MVARIQQFIACLLASSLAGAVLLGTALDMAWLPLAAAFALTAGYAGVLAAEFVLVDRSHPRDDAMRPRPGELVRAWAREICVAPRFFLWQQPFRSKSEPDHLPRAGDPTIGVVFLHGFFCNRGLWNTWMRRLRKAGVPFVAVTLEPVFGSIDAYASAISDAVGRVARAAGQPPVIVGHSMGGLAARAWLAKVDGAHAHALVTIASPHAGTHLARRGVARNVAQMRRASEWLRELTRLETERAPRTPTVCFWSRCDNIVVPAVSATLPHASNRHLVATPHVAMVCHPEVFDAVLCATGRAGGAGGSP